MRARIIKRIGPDKSIQYVIQQKHFLLRWLWVDAWLNSLAGAYCEDTFSTLEEAQKNLCYFDGTKTVDIVIKEEQRT